MIFVTVGTTDFDALVRHIDELAPKLREEVVCQIGDGPYIPQYCTHFRFAPSLDANFRQARLIVSHGGQGSLMDAMRLRKPLVAIANSDRRDSHQDDILSKLAAEHHLLWCRSLAELEHDIARAETYSFAPYVDPPCEIHVAINEYLGTASVRDGKHIASWLRRLGAIR